MNKQLTEFMVAAYQQQVMGAPVNSGQVFQKYKNDPAFMEAARTEMSRIKKLQGNIAARDFAAYQSLRALERELSQCL